MVMNQVFWDITLYRWVFSDLSKDRIIFIFSVNFDHDDKGNIFIRNIRNYLSNSTAECLNRLESSVDILPSVICMITG